MGVNDDSIAVKLPRLSEGVSSIRGLKFTVFKDEDGLPKTLPAHEPTELSRESLQ